MTIAFDGTTGYLEYAGRVVNSYPMSIAVWGTRTGKAVDQAWACQAKNAVVSMVAEYHPGNTEAKSAFITASGNGTAINKTSGPFTSTTVMQLFVLVMTSATSTTIYFGDSNGETFPDGKPDELNTHDRTLIGAWRYGGTLGAFTNGNLAEAHFFNAALTSANVAAMIADTVKPEAITGWVDGWKLDAFQSGGNYVSLGGTRTMVASGGVTSSAVAHPIARTTPVAVSFSGPVPTRNGVLGTASTFANAGFFAGNLTPFTYSSVGSALPAGVTLNTSTGVLTLAASGATAGTTSGIIIRATDTGSNVANTNAYSIVIAASNAAPTFPGNISNISGTAGTAITPVNVSGQFSDTDTLTYSASPAGTAWPSGLVVNSSTGIISGTVAGAGTTTGLKVRATDTAAQTVDSNALNVVIAAASTTVTFTPTSTLKAVGDNAAVIGAVAIHAHVYNMATGALLGTKTGLTSSSSSLPPPFTATYATAGTEYRVIFVDDANSQRCSIERITPV